MSGPCGLISLQRSHSRRCSRDRAILARMPMPMPTRAIAIPSHIRSLVRVTHAKDKNGQCAAITSS